MFPAIYTVTFALTEINDLLLPLQIYTYIIWYELTFTIAMKPFSWRVNTDKFIC